jgi:uncharacterized Fe-S cluster-containing radical SAM superfamily protein
MATTNPQSSAWVKLDILAHGVEIDSSVSEIVHSTQLFAARKNFYNTPLWLNPASSIPQEFRIGDLVIGLNSYGTSPWRLSWSSKEASLSLERINSGLRFKPELIPDLALFKTNRDAGKVANLYGGAALAFFSPRSCYFFANDTQCGFCSLAGTAKESTDFKNILSEQDVKDTVRSALNTDSKRIEQIMIVGGNMLNLDRGFKHHVSLACAALNEIEKSAACKHISIHIATMPPRDLSLIELLRQIPNVHVMFNLEVWDPKTFAEVCPGKAQDYGRSTMLQALERLRDVIGKYRAHSLLVTGLESSDSTMAGAKAFADMGISPIINIYHSDRHSRFGLGKRPSLSQLSEVAQCLQNLYQKFPLKPYWRNCGRNAIDAEAERGLFQVPVPCYLVPATF